MNEIGFKELQKIELSILVWIRSICEKHNLRYYLAYGTLIGAVRHKGFIPWDDDIDIHMPREDYDRFIQICSNHQDERYKLLSCEHTPGYFYEFAKVTDSWTIIQENNIKPIENYGVYVDVFPLDFLPNRSSLRIGYLRFLQRLRILLIYDDVRKYHPIVNLFCRIAKSLLSFINPVKIAQYINNVGRKGGNKSRKYLFVPGLRKALPASIIDNFVKISFEGELFDAPIGWDEYLTIIYGDYMKLPPIENQVTHHNFKAWYIKDSL